MYISFNAAVAAFQSGFTEHLSVAIVSEEKLSLVGFLCDLGTQGILGTFLWRGLLKYFGINNV